MSKHDISTFAFLDIETTNLPQYNFNKVNITEIAIICCMKSDLISQTSAEVLPRVKNKLVLCFNPRMLIHPTAEKLSGFDNYMLEQQNAFNRNAAETIVSFIKHQTQPVCLLAHNGSRFDFPILKRKIDNLELDIPDSVLCCDTLTTIKDIESEIEANQNILSDTEQQPSIDHQKLHAEDQEAKIIEEILNIPDESKNEDNLQSVTESKNDLWDALAEDQSKSQTINENTPKRKMPYTLKPVHTRRPVAVSGRNQNLKSRRTLFSPSKRESFTLTALHEKKFGVMPKIAHEAESDVVTLIKIALAYGKKFVDNAELNSVPFHTVKPKYN